MDARIGEYAFNDMEEVMATNDSIKDLESMIENIKKEIESTTIDLNRSGADTPAGAVYSKKIGILKKELADLEETISGLRAQLGGKMFGHYVPTPVENEYEKEEYVEPVVEESQDVYEEPETYYEPKVEESQMYYEQVEEPVYEEQYETVQSEESYEYNQDDISSKVVDYLNNTPKLKQEEIELEPVQESFDDDLFDEDYYEQENIYEEEQYEQTESNNIYEEEQEIYEEDIDNNFDQVNQIQETPKMKIESMNGVSNINITFKKGFDGYKITYDYSPKERMSLTKRDFVRINNREIRNMMRQLNSIDSAVKDKLFNETDFFVANMIGKKVDKKYKTSFLKEYENGNLKDDIVYDLNGILLFKGLSLKNKINMCNIALKQEKLGRASVILPDNIIERAIIQSFYKTHEIKVNNSKVNVKTKEVKDKKEFDINKVVNKFVDLFSFNDSKEEKENDNSEKMPLYKNRILKYAPFAGVGVLALCVGTCIAPKLNEKAAKPETKPNKGVEAVTTVNNFEQEKAQMTKVEEEVVVDDTKIVKVNDYHTLNGNSTCELFNKPFGGEPYSPDSIECDGFKVMQLFVYDKSDNNVLGIVDDENITSNDLYKKFGANIGILLRYVPVDENGKAISNNPTNTWYMNIDDYTSYTKEDKKEIANENTIVEEKKETTQEAIKEESKTEAVTEAPTEEVIKAKPEVTTNNASEKKETQKYTKENPPKEEEVKEPEETKESYEFTDSKIEGSTAHIVKTDKDGNIIDACTWTEYANGGGNNGSAKCLDYDSYEVSLVAAFDGDVLLKTVKVSHGENVNAICKNLYKEFGNNIDVVYNFDGYKNGKLEDQYLGFINKKVYDKFNENKDYSFYKEMENTFAENEIFKGYKLTFMM